MLDYIPKKMLMMHWDGGGIERSREGDEDGLMNLVWMFSRGKI